MPLSQSGGGYQISDGNLAEINLGVQDVPPTATATATLAVAQILNRLLIGSPSTTAATYTTPTATQIEAALVNVKVGSTFDLNIINLGTSTGVITLAGGTGVTLVGLTTLPTAAAGSSGQWRFRKTGNLAWTAYRIA